MRKLLLILALCCRCFAQTSVDGILTLSNVSPVTPGTQVTAGILNNGTIGSGVVWSFDSGTASAITVGPHQVGCSLGNPITVRSTGLIYTPAQPSQSWAYNNSSNFTNYFGAITPTGKRIISFRACIVLNSSVSNLYDMLVTYDTAGHYVALQQRNTNQINLETDGGGTLHSGAITLTIGQTYDCTWQDNETSGTASLACFLPQYPYTQVGTTVTVTQRTGVDLSHWRFGNNELGVAATTTYFENLMWDYTVGTFPLNPGTFYAPWAGLYSPRRAIDWRGAGFTGGIPTRPMCTVGSGTSIIPAGDSLTTTINNAINSCDANHAVVLGPGSFTSLGMLRLANDVELRGQGADQTKLNFTASGGCNGQPALVCWLGDNTDKTNPRNLTNWTAGYFPGATVITLTGPITNLTIGKSIILDQADDTTDLGGIMVSDTSSSVTATSPGVAGPRSLEGNGGGSQRSGRQQQQEVTVTSCNGSTTFGATCSGSNQLIGISPGLYMPNWDASKTPQAWWATTLHHGGGVQNFSIDSGSILTGAIPLKMLNVTQTYIKGVRSVEAQRAHVQVQFGSHITVQDSYFFFSNDSTSSSITKYGVECYGGADILVLNDIFQAVPGPRPENSACEGDVIILNYFSNIYFSQSAGWNNPFGNNHTAGTEYVDVELNVGNTWDADVFHGTHHFGAMHRNRFAGTQPACQNVNNQPSYSTATYGPCTNNRIGIQLRSWSRFFNVTGNVIGTSGINTTYTSTAGDRTIFTLNDGNSNGTVTVPDDPNVTTTLLRWANWDVVNNATRFQSSEVPSSLSANSQSPFSNFQPNVGNVGQPVLPASFFYDSVPSWWPATKAWPPIGPDVTGGNISGTGGHAFTIPAQDCALSVMGMPVDGTGPVLSFNANNCYSPSTNSPSRVIGGGHSLGGGRKVF